MQFDGTLLRQIYLNDQKVMKRHSGWGLLKAVADEYTVVLMLEMISLEKNSEIPGQIIRRNLTGVGRSTEIIPEGYIP